MAKLLPILHLYRVYVRFGHKVAQFVPLRYQLSLVMSTRLTYCTAGTHRGRAYEPDTARHLGADIAVPDG